MMITYRNQIREGSRSAGGLFTNTQPLLQLWFSHVNPVTLTCCQLVSYNHNWVVIHVLKAIMLPLPFKNDLDRTILNTHTHTHFFFFSTKKHSTNNLRLQPHPILWQEEYVLRKTSSESSTNRDLFPYHSHPIF